MRFDRLDTIWLALLAGTGTTWWLGEGGAGRLSALGTVALIFGLAVLKGRWVLLDYMALRQAPRLWRRLMLGWLFVLVALIVLIRWAVPAAAT